eukprot:tig00021621_g22962.t1
MQRAWIPNGSRRRRPVTATKNVSLQLLMHEGTPRFIVSDKGRIRQVMINLVGNAAKVSEAGGRVVVEVEAEGCAGPGGRHLFRIAATDAGPGISDEDQQKLFAFFTQLDASKSRRYHGTGLGLFISMNIARALEGGIALVSTPGSGSTFAFTFRAEPAPPADDLRPLPVPPRPPPIAEAGPG